MYLVVAKGGSTPCISGSFYLTKVRSVIFQLWSELEYNRGWAYADSGHMYIHIEMSVSFGHAHSLDTTIYKCYTLSQPHCTNSPSLGFSQVPFVIIPSKVARQNLGK